MNEVTIKNILTHKITMCNKFNITELDRALRQCTRTLLLQDRHSTFRVEDKDNAASSLALPSHAVLCLL